MCVTQHITTTRNMSNSITAKNAHIFSEYHPVKNSMSLPEEIDWRTSGAVTSVKDQVCTTSHGKTQLALLSHFVHRMTAALQLLLCICSNWSSGRCCVPVRQWTSIPQCTEYSRLLRYPSRAISTSPIETRVIINLFICVCLAVPYGNHGCSCGDLISAYLYIIDNEGVDTHYSYPYKSRVGS